MDNIISFINQKGGVGKTTAAINIASVYDEERSRVLLVDADPQGSLRDWAALGRPRNLAVIGLDRKGLAQELEQMAPDFDLVLIDSGGRYEQMTAEVISVSNVIIIPVTPSPLDIWASEDVLGMIETRKALVGDALQVRFLCNAVDMNSSLRNDVRDALLTHSAVCPTLENHLCRRVIYRRTINDGHSVLTSDDERAISETVKVATEIKDILNGEGPEGRVV